MVHGIPYRRLSLMVNYVLAQSLDDIITYVHAYKSDVIAIDVEASCKDSLRAEIAGMSLSLVPGSGIYIPFTHTGRCLPIQASIDIVRAKVEREGWKVLFYNAKYDLNVIELNTGWHITDFLDVLELVYLYDPDRLKKGLKQVAWSECNFKMSTFESLFTKAELRSKKKVPLDIRTRSGEAVRDYACADVDGTLRVYYESKYHQCLTQFKFAVEVDTALVDVIRRIENGGDTANSIQLNLDYIVNCINQMQQREDELTGSIWKQTGGEWNVNSAKQCGDVLFTRMRLPKQGKTKTGQYFTGDAALSAIARRYPVAQDILNFRKVRKARTTYFSKLKALHELKLPVRFQFNMYSAATYRLSSPGGAPLEDGFCGINIQAVSKGDSDAGIPSVRQAFQAPDGYQILSFDYDGQELRIGADLSGEPKWISAFQNNHDLHSLTGASAFGLSDSTTLPMQEQAAKRDIGKMLNFSIFYGVSAFSLSKRMGRTEAQAQEIINQMLEGLPVLSEWMERTKQNARDSGYTFTHFGRRRTLKQWYNSEKPADWAFADRAAVNTAVQGSGADIARLAMVRVDRMLTREHIPPTDCRAIMQIHDELVYLVKDERLAEMIPALRNELVFEVPGWPILLTVSAKAGKVWGAQTQCTQ